MPTLEIHDRRASGFAVVDPRHVLKVLEQPAASVLWQVAGVARYDEAPQIVGDAAADHLEELSRSCSRVSDVLLRELVNQTVQIIWGEFTAYKEGDETPWLIIRAIDSSWCEIETEDEDVLDLVQRTFTDVRMSAGTSAHQP